MKNTRISRDSWGDIKNLEMVNGKFKDGREYRILKCNITGKIEIFLDCEDFSKQNRNKDFMRFINIEFFSRD